jgi:hypothetical protein
MPIYTPTASRKCEFFTLPKDAIGYFQYDAGEKYEMQFNASPVTQTMFYLRTAGLIQVMLKKWETNKKVVTNI